jgi:hypothetical protein
MTDTSIATDQLDDTSPNPVGLLLIAAAGAGVAVSLGVYGSVHAPTGGRIFDLGFADLRAMKSALTAAAMSLIVVQIVSALAMFGRLPMLRSTPSWVAPIHRWSGTVAFVLTLPVVYHCLWALGMNTTSRRALLHGLFGCAFYGAMATKLLGLRATSLPRWAIPVLGSLLVVTLTAVCATSALWFYTGFDITRP